MEREEQPNTLNTVLARSVNWNWEIIAFVIIFFLAMFTRFYMLGDRAMSHDESLHTVFSNDLAQNGNYQHNPMMHGPILFHATALSYQLFGVDDFSSRIYPALLGVLMVMFPILLRRWLGRFGAVLTSVMILVSPLILYYNRYIRHDTPSMLSALLLFWAAMMYISGPERVRRKVYWLYIIAASMIWNLGSKETAFIYIAIFGLFLTIYWLVRVVQHIWGINGRVVFYFFNMATLLAGVMALAMIVVMTISLQAYPTLDSRLDFLLSEFGNLISLKSISVDFSTFLTWTALVFVSMLACVVSTGIWAYKRGAVSFNPLDALMVILSVALAIVITDALSHTTLTTDLAGEIQTRVVSTNAASLALGLVVSGSLLLIYAAFRIEIVRSFLRPFIILSGLTLLFCAGMILVEEISHEPSRATSEVQEQPIPTDPETGEVDYSAATSFREGALVLVWAVAAISIAGIVYTKSIGLWRHLKFFPEFDVLMVMGSLILPWLTAVFITLAHSGSVDWMRIGQEMQWLGKILPTQNNLEVGQFVIGFLAWLPMMAVAVIAGAAWNWKRWLGSFIVFHIIFLFFFTTVFTNIEGIASGMIYSLQYWFEQQGVKRGSQPQYYYAVVIMPIYEFLPIIGSFLAMLAGLVFFWRRQRQYEDDQQLPILDGEETVLEALLDAPVENNTDEEKVKYIEPYEMDIPSALMGFVSVFMMITGMTLALFNSLLRWNETVNLAGFINSVIKTSIDLSVSSTLLLILGVGLFAVGIMLFATWYSTYGAYYQYLSSTEPQPSKHVTEGKWKLDSVPFLLFVGWWAVLNFLGYTLAGEKMPWLGVHISLPMIILTGWYFGRVIERVNWHRFTEYGWFYMFLIPLAMVALFQTIAPLFGNQTPFQGTAQIQLQWTYSWLAALIILAASLYGIYWGASKFTGWHHVRQLTALASFTLLAVLTFRAAWLANYINYDYANEFLVYAHAGPANKFVVEELLDLSIRTTGGTDMNVMHDNRFSWPGSWYLRDFSASGSVIYIDQNVPSLQDLDNTVAVIVGDSNRSKVEPLLGENYQRFDYIRMWWPMQDYFGLTAQRINDMFDFDNSGSAVGRRGLFDIWWNRDYANYEQSRLIADPNYPNHFTLTDWPVSDSMSLYIRKDVAAQVWQYGVGEVDVLNAFTSVEPDICLENFIPLQPQLVFNDAVQPFARPLGLDITDDGQVFIANESEGISRISIYNTSGTLLSSFGQQGGMDVTGAFFNRPHSVAVASDGTIYVADTWNFRISAFTPELEFITSWGQPDTRGFDVSTTPTDGFWGPRDVAIDELGRVYVADTGNKRVRVYTADGVFLRDIGIGGSGDGQLNEPTGLAISGDRLFVADTRNRRVAVFNLDGSFIQNIPVRGWTEDLGNRPYIAVDPTRDLLYVNDYDAARILVYTTTGDCVGSFGQAIGETQLTQFGTLGGIAVDADGNVYVTDLAYSQVLQFEPFPVPMAVDMIVQPEVTPEVQLPEATPEVTDDASAE